MMEQQHLQLLESSIRLARQQRGGDWLAAELFRRFFDRFPDARRQFFADTDIGYFGERKFNIIAEFLLDTLRHPNFAEGNMCNEMMRHQMYGLADKAYYFGLVDALMESVQTALAEQWNEQYAECWNDTTAALKGFVQAGAAYLD